MDDRRLTNIYRDQLEYDRTAGRNIRVLGAELERRGLLQSGALRLIPGTDTLHRF